MPKLESIQVGVPRTYGDAGAEDPFDRPWTSAIFKQPITGSIAVGRLGLVGDGQADLENHGGVDKAVLLYSADHYPDWRLILGPGSEMFGAFGENLSVSGSTEASVCIGDVWQVGEQVRIQVSQPRQPCWKLARKWRVKDLVAQVQENGRTGWYCRVLTGGAIEAGQALTLIDRPQPNWPVAAANQVMHHRQFDAQAARELAGVPELAASWRGSLASRAARLIAP